TFTDYHAEYGVQVPQAGDDSFVCLEIGNREILLPANFYGYDLNNQEASIRNVVGYKTTGTISIRENAIVSASYDFPNVFVSYPRANYNTQTTENYNPTEVSTRLVEAIKPFNINWPIELRQTRVEYIIMSRYTLGEVFEGGVRNNYIYEVVNTSLDLEQSGVDLAFENQSSAENVEGLYISYLD